MKGSKVSLPQNRLPRGERKLQLKEGKQVHFLKTVQLVLADNAEVTRTGLLH